jgi:beta-glucosidase/6-phospho-beta-glucosidase/beta-galactosidase
MDESWLETRLPEPFLLGVATAAFQVEGGINGPGEPANNWAGYERAGRGERSGEANRFFRSPEILLERARAIGCNAFRLGLEWARLEPRENERDPRALLRYCDLLEACRARGLTPVVTLHHFTHPAWLGEAAWLPPEGEPTARRFAMHAAWLVEAVGLELERRGGRPLELLITLNEINVLAIMSTVLGVFPPGERAAFQHAAEMLDALALAHVLAYDAIHDLYLRRGWQRPQVTTNNFCFGLYELDRMILDLFTARTRGVAPGRLPASLLHRRARWYAELEGAPRARAASGRGLTGAFAPLVGQLLGERLPRCRRAIEASPRAEKLDAIALDYYDPFPEAALQLPGRKTGLGRSWLPLSELWETPVNPEGFGWFLRAAGDYGLPVLVAENGLASARRGETRAPRADGWTRGRYLRANLAALFQALAGGVPIMGYLHWSLADNYEWGSTVPRFGLHGYDHERGVLEESDSLGEPAAAVYREIIAALRGGDPAERRRVLLGPGTGGG